MAQNPSNEPDNETQVLLTRTQAARAMGVSVSTVRRMENVELAPIVVDGTHLFHLEDVQRFRRLNEGQLAARAFEMFSDLRTIVDVVIELEQPPEVVEKLYAAFERVTKDGLIRTTFHKKPSTER